VTPHRLFLLIALAGLHAQVARADDAAVIGAAPPPPAATTRWGESRLRGLVATRFVDDPGDAGPRAWIQSRVTAGFRDQLAPDLQLTVELEALNGYVAGDATALGTSVDDHPFPVARDGRGDLVRVLPRQAYVAWTTRVGRVTAGAQSFGWGTGMLANDGAGDEPFGDAWTGNVVARLAFATRPMPALAVFAAGDYVLRDDNANVYDGDRAVAAVIGARATAGPYAAGVLASVRHQRDRDEPYRPGAAALTTAYVVDAWGRLGLDPAAGQHVALEAEGALVLGHSTRPWSDATVPGGADLRQLGGVARVRWDHDAARLTATLEGGYASGDDDPLDATARTFTMHTDHNVGLVLFDQALPLVSARGVDRASDPMLVGAPTPGLRFAINPGAVQNAIYGAAVAKLRPAPPLDLRLGYVYAVPAADLVDPYETALHGGFATSAGGRMRWRGAYGHELDARAAYDVHLPRALVLRTGLEGGVLVPGAAFDGVPGIHPDGGPARALWLGRVLLSLLW
jgi:hypothetical protein